MPAGGPVRRPQLWFTNPIAPDSRVDVRSQVPRGHIGVVSGARDVSAMAQAVSNHDAEEAGAASQRLVYPKMGLLFVVVIGCFTAWGIAADLTTPMVA
ncbi:MAG: transporter, family, L-fucose permease, partial [Pseudonocardiales bacterium]|nr:transporter, family, L-fucose permease [Pseudonocardiales bacterium]